MGILEKIVKHEETREAWETLTRKPITLQKLAYASEELQSGFDALNAEITTNNEVKALRDCISVMHHYAAAFARLKKAYSVNPEWQPDEKFIEHYSNIFQHGADIADKLSSHISREFTRLQRSAEIPEDSILSGDITLTDATYAIARTESLEETDAVSAQNPEDLHITLVEKLKELKDAYTKHFSEPKSRGRALPQDLAPSSSNNGLPSEKNHRTWADHFGVTGMKELLPILSDIKEFYGTHMQGTNMQTDNPVYPHIATLLENAQICFEASQRFVHIRDKYFVTDRLSANQLDNLVTKKELRAVLRDVVNLGHTFVQDALTIAYLAGYDGDKQPKFDSLPDFSSFNTKQYDQKVLAVFDTNGNGSPNEITGHLSTAINLRKAIQGKGFNTKHCKDRYAIVVKGPVYDVMKKGAIPVYKGSLPEKVEK